MKDSLEEEIKKILEIIKICPPDLKEACFKVLLEDALKQKEKKEPIGPEVIVTPKIPEEMKEIPPEINKKLRTLATQIKINPEQLLKIFSIEGDIIDINPMIDLGVTQAALKQRKLALLIAISNFLTTGEYKILTEELRQKCVDFGAYDPTNFSSNLKKMKDLFTGRFDIKKDQKLSSDGKKAAVELIRELLKKE